MNKAIVAILALGLTGLAGVPNVGAVGPQQPLACIDGTFVSDHDGRSYDTSAVTGSGTAADPYVIANISINHETWYDYPEMILLRNCEHVEIRGVLIHKVWARVPQCHGDWNDPNDFGEIQVWEGAKMGIHVNASSNIRIEETTIKYTRWSALRISDNSTEVNVTASNFWANHGGAVWMMHGAHAEFYLTTFWYNGHFAILDQPYEYYKGGQDMRAGWYPYRVKIGGIGIGAGASATVSNGWFEGNSHHVMVDKSWNESSDVVVRDSDFRAASGPHLRVIGHETTFTNIGGSCGPGPAWWWGFAHGTKQGAGYNWPVVNAKMPSAAEVEAAADAQAPFANPPTLEAPDLPSHRDGAPLPDLPKPVYDAVNLAGVAYWGAPRHTNPLEIVDGRANFWGHTRGAAAGLVSLGNADVALPLAVAPPLVEAMRQMHHEGKQRDFWDFYEVLDGTLP